MVTVFLLDEAFPDLWVPKMATGDGSVRLHYGVVRDIREKNGKWSLDVEDERGFRVRLNYYGDVESLFKVEEKDDRGGSARDRAKASYTDPWSSIGKEISFSTRLTVPDPVRNPHGFDYRKYLLSEKIYLTGTIKVCRMIGSRDDIVTLYKRILYKLKAGFRDCLPEDSRGLIMGMVFGDTSELDEEVYDDFRRNGTAHILAVSGLHIGILYSIYEKLSRGKTDPKSLLILAFILYTYGVLACWRPSVIRAEIMICFKSIAKAAGLRYDSLTAMSAAAVILMLNDPYVIYGTGFQMSFLAIMAIKIVLKAIPEKVPDSLAQTLAVNLTLMLYQAYVFNFISPLAVLINIPVLYLAGISIPLAFMTFLVYGAHALIASGAVIPEFVFAPACSVGELLIKANGLMNLKGYSSIDVISPPSGVMIFVIVAMLFGCSEFADLIRIRKSKEYFAKCFAVIAVISLLFSLFTIQPISHDQIVFVDVGQGACTHIRSGGLDVMIDGGGARDRSVGEKTLKPYLLKNGARDLDLALATHEDMDHIKGLEELKDCFRVKDLVMWSAAGEVVRLEDDVAIETLWPIGGPDTQDDKQENDESSVFMIHYKGVKVLVTGDLGEDGERDMIKFYESQGRPDKIRADVLNVGHHGSKHSTSDEFLEAVKPRFAVIQVGRNNYGHPSKETLERLEAHGIQILRNDRDGAIGLRIGKSGIKAIHLMIG